MRSIYLTPSFKKALNRLSSQEREKTTEAIGQFFDFLLGRQMTGGLGYKKLAEDIFEFRVNIHLRIAGIVEEDKYYLYVVGSHDEIRRFLRERR